MTKRGVLVWTIAAVVALFAAMACGSSSDQTTPASVSDSRPGGIEGTVADAQGGPLAGMRVGIVSGTEAFPEIAPETDEEGHYQIGGVAPGTFQVAVHDTQGERIGLESVTVRSGETATLNFSLSGAAAEKQAALPLLPVMRLRHAGQVYDGVQGSYCWPVGRTEEGQVEEVCADKVSWETLGAAIPVDARDSVTIEIEAEDSPQGLFASFFEVDSDSGVRFTPLGSGLKVPLAVDLDSGVYNVSVFGQWAAGQMLYEFRIEVRPDPSAKFKVPTDGLCLPAAALGVSVGDMWTISGPVKIPTVFSVELPPDAAEMTSTFVVEAIKATQYVASRGSVPIENRRVELRVTNITLDADGNVLTSQDTSGTWSPTSAFNLGPVLTIDWECHETAWLEAWSDEGDASVSERTLSSGVTAVVFTVQQPLVVPAQGIDATTERYHGYDKLTGRAVLQQVTASGTRDGEPFNMDMLQELVPSGSTSAPPGTGPESCQKYLNLLVSTDEGGTEEPAVVTSYQCMSLYVDSTAQYPSKEQSLTLKQGVPLSLRLAAEQQPAALELRLYSGAGISASFGKWPEELFTDQGPVDTLQPTPSLSFQYLPQQPPGEYSLLVRATWDGPVNVFYATSLKLE